MDRAEHDRIEGLAATLGVDRPLVDGRLRLNFGRCVFLDADHRCRLHSHGGPAAKPRVCRQFPFVAVTVGGTRIEGVDPGCLHGLEAGGDPPEESLLSATTGAAADTEALALLRAPTLGAVGASLGWGPADAEAWLARVPWPALSESADLGPLLRESARALSEACGTPTAWPEPAHEGALLDGMRRMVTLQLLPRRGSQAVEALLAGGVRAATVQPADPRRLAAAWFRLVRLL